MISSLNLQLLSFKTLVVYPSSKVSHNKVIFFRLFFVRTGGWLFMNTNLYISLLNCVLTFQGYQFILADIPKLFFISQRRLWSHSFFFVVNRATLASELQCQTLAHRFFYICENNSHPRFNQSIFHVPQYHLPVLSPTTTPVFL